MVTLKPYELTAADLPSGFSAGAVSTSTSALEAINQAAAGADPYAALDRLQSEGTQVCTDQPLTPVSVSALRSASVSICVMATPEAAQTVAAGSARSLPASSDATTVTPTTLGETLGDGTASAWQVTSIAANGQTVTGYDVRWSRGLLAFELRTAAAPSQTDVASSASLGAALDTSEATRPPVTLGTPTVMPPATEVERVYTALAEQRAAVPVSQPPRSESLPYSQDVIHPADTVRAAANPVQALHTVDEVYQRVITADQVFRTRDRVVIDGERITVDASAQGALAELNTGSVRRPTFRVGAHDETLPGAVVSYEPVPSPIQLGDSTSTFRITVAYPNVPNTPREVSYSIGWTHGRVFLQARYGTDEARNPTADAAVPFAQQVEADFQASDLATMTADTTSPATTGFVAAHTFSRADWLSAVLPSSTSLPRRRPAPRARKTG